jgi:rubrerythrin
MAGLQENILNKAIQKEINARDFYADVSAKIINGKGRKRMLNLSKEEDFHRKMLENRYKKLFGKDFKAEPEIPLEFKFAAAEDTVLDSASSLEIVSIAIGIEEAAINQYSDHLAAINDPEDQKLLRKLVKFEQGHKSKLQREHARLTKSPYWLR